MREYKYRAKPKQTGGIKSELAWAYGDLVQKNGKAYIAPSHNAVKVENNLARLMVLIEVDPETVGQYINKKDTTGKEIYEGDYDVVDGEMYFIAKYVDGELGMVCWEPGDEAYFDDCVSWDDFTVRGNRWDNPELLGEVRD